MVTRLNGAAAKKTAIFWKPDERALMAKVTLDVMESDRTLSTGQAAVIAQERVIPEGRKKSLHDLRYSVERILGKDLETEIRARDRVKKEQAEARKNQIATADERRSQEAMDSLAARAKSGSAEDVTVKMIPPSPAPTQVLNLSEKVEATKPVVPNLDMTVEQLIDVLTDNISDKVIGDFRVALYKKVNDGIIKAHREVLADSITNGIAPLFRITPAAPPPAPSPVPSQVLNGSHAADNNEGVPTFNRVKVALVGNAEADDMYFNRVSSGLEKEYEFIRVKKPGDMHGQQDAKVIILASDQGTPAALAAKAIAKNAVMMQGKSSATLKNWLEMQYRVFQTSVIKDAVSH